MCKIRTQNIGDAKQRILTERDFDVLQTQIVERDHAHEDQTQWKHLHQLLTLEFHHREVI